MEKSVAGKSVAEAAHVCSTSDAAGCTINSNVKNHDQTSN